MMLGKEYWGKYYNFWDEFVGRWLAERKTEAPLDEVALAYQQACNELDFDILPTPYLGRPSEGVDAVFLNMNPGLSEIGKRGAYKGMSLDDTQHWIYTNLAAALLFLGKTKEAETICRQCKDELKEAILDDFKAYAEAGVTPRKYERDVEQIKHVLNE